MSYSSHNGEFAGARSGLKQTRGSGEFKPEQVYSGLDFETELAILAVALQERPEWLCNQELVVIHPATLDVVESFSDGLPDRLIRFDAGCDLMRHEAIVTVSSNVDNLDETTVRRFVEKFFLSYHWFGPSRDANKFRNWEHHSRWLDKRDEWDWDTCPQCPVCGKDLTSDPREHGEYLDTDHHDRRTDTVLLVCRECHHYGHNSKDWKGGEDTADDAQDAKAQRLGFRDSRDLKFSRYVKRYLSEHDEEELEKRYELDGGKWEHLAWRLNAFTSDYGTDIDARAEELEAVYSEFEQLVESDLAKISEPNTRPRW